MNEKMEKIAHNIKHKIMRDFPSEYLNIVFEEGRFEISDIIIQIMVECCKYAYDATTEKHSLLYYTREQNTNPDDEDSEHKQIARTLEYINARRDAFYNVLLKRGIQLDGLKPPEMKTMAEKLKGYKLTPFQFWEINDVHDNRIIKSILDNKIIKKNYSIDRFLEEEEYYNSVLEDAFENIDKGYEIVESFLRIFILESRYPLDFYYLISEFMIQNKTNTIYNCKSRIAEFCADSSLQSRYPGNRVGSLTHYFETCDNRMLRIRPNYIDSIVLCNEFDFNKNVLYYNEGRYIVASILAYMRFDDVPLRQWFTKNTDCTDWESVFIEYDIKKVINLNKDWSNTKTIRYIRNIFKELNNS